MHLHWVSGGTGLPTRGIGFLLSFMGRETHATKAVLAKNLKGKPTVQSGTKQEIDGGWKFNVVANVGPVGAFDLVVMTEKSMTLGCIESQTPKAEPKAAPAKAKS